MTRRQPNIFDKVLFVGPYRTGRGGIMSVMNVHQSLFSPYHYAPTCSHWGHFFSMFVLGWLLVRLPFIRLFSERRILHIHFASYGSFLRKSLVMRWGKMLGFKVTGHCHGGKFQIYCREKGFDKISKKLSHCDTIIALSESWKRFFKDELGIKNVEVVWNPIAPVDDPRNEQNDCVELLFLGRIGEGKGIFDLINTISAHKEELSGRIHLSIGGDGEVGRLTHTIVENNLEGIVDYIGWTSGKEKDALLRKSNVVVLPSYNEGVPISLLEAMAYGKGIITTPVGGIPEIVEHGKNGLLIEPGNNNGLFEAILSYINNRGLAREQGRESLKKIEKSYPENVKTQLVKIYSNLISQ